MTLAPAPCPQNAAPHRTPRIVHGFDARSVVLMAALGLGGASALQAQTSSALPASSQGSTASPQRSSSPAPPRPAVAEAAFERADANRDGKLSAQEADTLPAIGARFEQLDKDRDGFLSREEFDEGAQS